MELCSVGGRGAIKWTGIRVFRPVCRLRLQIPTSTTSCADMERLTFAAPIPLLFVQTLISMGDRFFGATKSSWRSQGRWSKSKKKGP